MANIRDVIKREADKKTFPVEGQQVIEFLPLDEAKGKEMYFKGPPEMVYCKLPNGLSIRVALIETGVYSNEVKIDPRGFRVMIPGPYYRLPRGEDAAVTYGELVRAIPKKQDADVDPTIPSPLMGHSVSSSVVKSVEIGGSSVKVGESGDIELKCDGQVVRSLTKDVVIARTPENSTVMFGGDRKVIFKESFLGMIMPKFPLPPGITPNWMPNMDIMQKGTDLLSNATSLAGTLA